MGKSRQRQKTIRRLNSQGIDEIEGSEGIKGKDNTHISEYPRSKYVGIIYLDGKHGGSLNVCSGRRVG